MITQEQIEFYNENGFVLVPQLFTSEYLDQLENDFEQIIERRLANRANLDRTWKGEWKKGMGETALIHTEDVQAYSAAWAQALHHNPLTDAFSKLIGSPNVQLHHTKLFSKPPKKGSAFPMHQDVPYFPHENHTMMAGIIHLSDSDESMGCVRAVPGSHKLGYLETFEHNHLDPKQYPIEQATPCIAKRGDVLFFHYLTIHGSGINTSENTRKTVLIQVRDPTDTPTDDQHHSHAQGLMLRGMDPLSHGKPSHYFIAKN